MSNAVVVRENGKARSVSAATVVHFDRPLHQLDEADAEAWRAWLTQHQLDHMLIACPSVLTYREPTKRKPAATVIVELLSRDPQGALRSKKTVYFSGPLLPFPAGYEITTTNARSAATRFVPELEHVHA